MFVLFIAYPIPAIVHHKSSFLVMHMFEFMASACTSSHCHKIQVQNRIASLSLFGISRKLQQKRSVVDTPFYTIYFIIISPKKVMLRKKIKKREQNIKESCLKKKKKKNIGKEGEFCEL